MIEHPFGLVPIRHVRPDQLSRDEAELKEAVGLLAHMTMKRYLSESMDDYTIAPWMDEWGVPSHEGA